jgi:hypothetical protein
VVAPVPPIPGGGVVGAPASATTAPELLLLDPVAAPPELEPVGLAPELEPAPELLLELDEELEPEPAPGLPEPAPPEPELLEVPPPPLELLGPAPLELEGPPPLLELLPPTEAPELLLPVPTETGAPASGSAAVVAPASAVLPAFARDWKPLGSVKAVSAAHAASMAADNRTPVRTDVFFMAKSELTPPALLTKKSIGRTVPRATSNQAPDRDASTAFIEDVFLL